MIKISALDCVKCIKSGDSVYIQGGASVPHCLVDALTSRADELSNVKIYTSFTVDSSEVPYAKKEFINSFEAYTFFVSQNIRNAVQEGIAQKIPCNLHEIPNLFREKHIPIDVVIINVSRPDKYGYCSYGISSDITCAAIESAKIIVAQINSRIPYVYGDSFIHISKIDYYVEYDELPTIIRKRPISSIERSIAQYISNEIPNGATLQIGVGGVPDALLETLDGHKHLGLHSEAISDGVIELIQKGIIDNSCKKIYPGISVASIGFGSSHFYNFVSNNRDLLFKDVSWVNDPYIIGQNPEVISINSALEIDITGQVCADSLGTNIYSGIGGQHDFVYGASISKGGKSFIVLPSLTNRGGSKIVSSLKDGAGVTISRFQIQYVVTEYGIANLSGKSLPQRAKLLIQLAHPEKREHLEKEAVKRYGISFLKQR